MTDIKDKKLVTKEELAACLRTSVASINRWMVAGKIQYIKIDRRVLFDLNLILKNYTTLKTSE